MFPTQYTSNKMPWWIRRLYFSRPTFDHFSTSYSDINALDYQINKEAGSAYGESR